MQKLLRFYESSAIRYSGTYCGTELLKFEKTIYEAIIILLFICICMSCSTESHQVSVIGQEVSDSFVRVDEKCVDGLYCIEECYLRDSLLACIDRCDSCVFHAYDLNRNSILFFSVRKDKALLILFSLFSFLTLRMICLCKYMMWDWEDLKV